MNLFEECLEALGEHAKVCDKNLNYEIRDNFDKNFKLKWGRIQWDICKDKHVVLSIDEIIPTIKEKNKNPFKPIYIIGGDPTVPIVESRLDKALEVFDDVEAVSHITWFFCPSDGWVVQVDDDDTITIGFV